MPGNLFNELMHKFLQSVVVVVSFATFLLLLSFIYVIYKVVIERERECYGQNY